MRNLAVIIPSLIIFAVAGLSHAGVYSFARRQNHDWFETLNPVFPIINAVTYVRKSTAEKNIVVQPLGRDAKVVDALSTTKRKPRVTIVVVGETARASSFQLGATSAPQTRSFPSGISSTLPKPQVAEQRRRFPCLACSPILVRAAMRMPRRLDKKT